MKLIQFPAAPDESRVSGGPDRSPAVSGGPALSPFSSDPGPVAEPTWQDVAEVIRLLKRLAQAPGHFVIGLSWDDSAGTCVLTLLPRRTADRPRLQRNESA